MKAFIQFVEENARWFRGLGQETTESLDSAEQTLQIRIPNDVRWLLTEYGYWHATGISSLEETIEHTEAARKHLHLPDRFIILYDHQDGGVILLDTIATTLSGTNKVYNVGWESVPDNIGDGIVYDSYLEYVRYVLDVERDFLEEKDIDFDPTQYNRA